MATILGIVTGVLPLILGLFKGHSQASNTTTPLPAWITSLENIIGGASNLNPWNSTGNDISNILALLTDVTTNGGGLFSAQELASLSSVTAVLTKYANLAHDYVSGQVTPIFKFTFEGTPGWDFAISDAGLAVPIVAGATTMGGALGITGLS